MEIERKFLISKENLPADLNSYPHHRLEQGYLSTAPVVRIRKEDDNYYLTYKSKGLMTREEYNLPLTKESYEHMRPKADGILISKTRYLIPEKDRLTIELDVFDGVEHILAGGRGGVRLAGDGFLHQSGNEQIKVTHHGGLVLGLQPAGGVDVSQGGAHAVRVAGVVYGGVVGKGQLGCQLVGAGTVEAHPTVLPGVLLIGGVADELAGARKEQISGADLPGSAAYLEFALAREHQVDQVMVTDARTPGLGRGAALNAAVEDGKFDVVRVVLFEGLLVNVCHGGLTSLVVTSFDQYTTEPPANSTKVHLIL